MDVARSAPQGSNYHAEVIYLIGNKEGIKGLMVKPIPTRFPLYPDGQHTLAFYTAREHIVAALVGFAVGVTRYV